MNKDKAIRIIAAAGVGWSAFDLLHGFIFGLLDEATKEFSGHPTVPNLIICFGIIAIAISALIGWIIAWAIYSRLNAMVANG